MHSISTDTLAKEGYQVLSHKITAQSLSKLEQLASTFSTATTADRKNIFARSPEVQVIFSHIKKRFNQEGFRCEMTPYCFYLEKTEEKNWPLQIHQDINLPSYLNLNSEEETYWLEQGIWVRVNLDANDKSTGALKVIPKSHLAGKNGAVDKTQPIFLDVNRGDIVLFSPLTYHGSDKMTRKWTRRVFQCLFLQSPNKKTFPLR